MAGTTLVTSMSQLQASLKTLRARWEVAQLFWQDRVREEFEKNAWEPLESQLLGTLKGMENLTRIMGQVRQDAE